MTPQRRYESEHDREHRHQLRPHAVDRAMLDDAHELRQRGTPPTTCLRRACGAGEALGWGVWRGCSGTVRDHAPGGPTRACKRANNSLSSNVVGSIHSAEPLEREIDSAQMVLREGGIA